jgi:hypothetical protein
MQNSKLQTPSSKFAEGRIRRGGLPVASQSGVFHLRGFFAFSLCSVGVLLAMFGFGATVGNWSIVPSPNATSAPTTNILNAVTCTSVSDCWAVGYAPAGNATQTLVEHWDGTSWEIVASPNTSATQNNILTGVTCASASDCRAVGYYFSGSTSAQTLIERWNGSSWTIVTSPNTSATQSNILFGVTCVSASNCWAVGVSYDGSYFNNSVRQTLVERWDGTSWTIVTSPNSSATQSNYLSGVACAAASNCWAVGYYSASTTQTLIERWDGTSWAIVTSPNASATQSNYLNGVTCTSASDCWAVGSYSASGASQTLIERWDGTSWVIATSPNNGATQNNYLLGVNCGSASDCWSVGYYVVGITYQTLVERWDGTAWVIVTSPNPSGSQSSYLQAVACASGAADCWSVGYYYPNGGGGAQTLVERWDGTSWVITTSPNNGATQSNVLSDVACTSTSDCWGVGYYLNGNGIGGLPAYQTLIERWDGSAWTIVTSPNTSTIQNNFLLAVTCASASECWAVGYYKLGNPYQTLIELWDGSSWTIVTSPNASTTHDDVLFGVTCASASDCWAVGYSVNIILSLIGANQTLIEHWNGISWTIVSSANTLPVQDNFLRGVACASATDCWAVGNSSTGVANQSLIERWDGSSWSIVAHADSSAASNVFYGVTCVSATDCWAVGDSTASSSQTLIDRWDGTSWATVASPNSGATQNNFLQRVTCTSPTDCWVIGYYNTGNADQTLIERWDGTSWAIATSPNTNATHNNVLSGVTCVSASDCWAVGYYNDASGYPQTLTERFAPPPVPLVSVVSELSHGSAGTFDVTLPLSGSPGIECRSGGANGDYTLVFTFATPLTSVSGASVSSGVGLVGSSSIDGSDAHNYVVNLTGVTNTQYLTVSLSNVTDSVGNFSSSASATMGVLLGDVNSTGRTDAGDVTTVRNNTVSIPDQQTFRYDVNTSGRIDAGDVTVTRNASVTVLP